MNRNRPFLKLVFFVALFAISLSLYSQQKQLPKTFLWRISGNGLTKPSYLYGTMHLTDKKLFYFTDSLYSYLQSAEGFHIEVDADSLVAFSVKKYMEKNKGKLLKSLLTKNEYNKYAYKLSKSLKKPADKITTRDIWLAKNQRSAEAYKKGDMSSFMDMYLYGIAKREGKILGGIEDIQDQENLIDEAFDNMDLDYIVSDSAQKEGDVYLQKMKNIYVSQDLNQIDEIFNQSYSAGYKYLLLTKRNIKMATRMDSIARQRSSFFAVGAAHLPGDSGVIDLLRKRGYNVEPVFSSVRIAPEKYTVKEVAVPWKTYNQPLKLYNVQVPGAMQSFDMYKQVMDMQYYFDLTETKAYFTAVATSAVDLGKKDSVFSSIIGRMSTDSKIVSRKTIEKQGFEGCDVILKTLANGLLRMNVYIAKSTIYLIMVSAQTEEETNDANTKKFFDSFSMTPSIATSKPYINYSDAELAFSVRIPENPAIADMASSDKGGHGRQFSSTDYSNGNYFLVSVRDTKAGSYYANDTTYFNAEKEKLEPLISYDTLHTKQTMFLGYPALKIEGRSKTENLYYHTLTVLRGNRSYSLIMSTAKSNSYNELADSFFHSFTLTDYKPAAWQIYTAPDSTFTGWFPAEIADAKKNEFKETDSDSAEAKSTLPQNEFIAYDKFSATSYQVQRQLFNEYYHAKNDSAFFKEIIQFYQSAEDTLTSFAITKSGVDETADVQLENHSHSIIKKFRFILHGDTLYKVFTYLPSWFVNNNTEKLVDSFSILTPAPATTLFDNKIIKLVSDLSSSDSATFDKASSYIREAVFTIKDLPFIHPLLIRPLKDFDEGFYNTNNSLINVVADIADSTTVDFINTQYPLLKGGQAKLQYQLLKLLVKMKQPYAVETAKKLLKLNVPPQGNPAVFISALDDTLPLAKTLFPYFITFTKDTASALEYAYLVKDLLDSNYITKEELLPHLNNFIESANIQRKKIKTSSDDYDYNVINLINLFGTVNNTQTNAQLQLFSKVSNLNIKSSAADWLITNGQPVNTVSINDLAASDHHRLDLYNSLKKTKKTALFPTAYLHQKMFAAAYIYSNASDDDVPDKVSFVMEKTATYKGKKQKFYLYKTTFGADENANSYLGIAGPFSLNPKTITSENEATGLDWNEKYSYKEISSQFDGYMKKLESNENDKSRQED